VRLAGRFLAARGRPRKGQLQKKAIQTRMVPQDRAAFFDALSLSERRLDKGDSLTDCRSMLLMKYRGLTDILTHDHQLTQEGFTILFP